MIHEAHATHSTQSGQGAQLLFGHQMQMVNHLPETHESPQTKMRCTESHPSIGQPRSRNSANLRLEIVYSGKQKMEKPLTVSGLTVIPTHWV